MPFIPPDCGPKTGPITKDQCLDMMHNMAQNIIDVNKYIASANDQTIFINEIDKYCEHTRKLQINFTVYIPITPQRRGDINRLNNRCADKNANGKPIPPFTAETKEYCFDVGFPTADDDLIKNGFGTTEDNYPLQEGDEYYSTQQESGCNSNCGGFSTIMTTTTKRQRESYDDGSLDTPGQPGQKGSLNKVCVTISNDDYHNPKIIPGKEKTDKNDKPFVPPQYEPPEAGSGLVVKKTVYIDITAPCGGTSVNAPPPNPNNAKDEAQRQQYIQRWIDWMGQTSRTVTVNNTRANCICDFVSCYSNPDVSKTSFSDKNGDNGYNIGHDNPYDMGMSKDDGVTSLNIEFTANNDLTQKYPDNENEVSQISDTETWIKSTYATNGTVAGKNTLQDKSCTCTSIQTASFPPGSVQRDDSDGSLAAGGYTLSCKGCNENSVATEVRKKCFDKANNQVRTFIFCSTNGTGNVKAITGTYNQVFQDHSTSVSDFPWHLDPRQAAIYFDGEFYEIKIIDGKERIVNKGTENAVGGNPCGGSTPNPPVNPNPPADPVVVPNPPDKDPDPDKAEPINDDVFEF